MSDTVVIELSSKLEGIYKEVTSLSVLEVAELVKAMESRLGISAAAPAAMGGFAGGAVVGAVVGAAGDSFADGYVGGNEILEEPAKFAKRFLACVALSSALVFGGDYIGQYNNEVSKATIISEGTNNVGTIVLQQGNAERQLYQYGTNDRGKVFLPRKDILRLESEKLNDLDK